MRYAIIFVIFTICVLPGFAQTQTGGLRQLQGRVVEVTNGQTNGVPEVTVSISDNFDYDITDQNGFFKLTFPPDRDFVTVVVENSPNKMIAPPSGLVNIPPDRDLQIVLCGEQNQKLIRQVNALNNRIKKLEKENSLSKRQLLEMHRILLDTILHFENALARLGQQSKETKTALDAEIRARDARIEVLQDSVQLLVQALGKALEERFQQQKAYYDQISAGLLEYTDKLKDLRDMAIPPHLNYCFRNNTATEELIGKIEAYEKVRGEILRDHGGLVLFVKQYWGSPEPAARLKDTYHYLLETVHKTGLLNLDRQVFGQIREYATGQVGRTSAEKEARKRSEQLVPALNTDILELERKIRETLLVLSNNI